MQTSLNAWVGLFLAVAPGALGSAAPEMRSPVELDTLRRQGSAQYASRQFAEAAASFAQCAELASRQNRLDVAIPCWNNAGGANLALLQLGPAMEAFFRSRELARQNGKKELEAVSETNLASIYLMLGDADAASGALRSASDLLPSGSRYLGYLFGQRARLAFRGGDEAAVLPLLTRAIQEAEALGDRNLLALLWDDLAAFRLNRQDLAGAEEALAQEFRIRLLFHPPHPEYAYIRAGRLKLAQGRPAEALAWFDRADAARKANPGPYLPWVGERDRGAALEAAGRIPEALAASRHALRLALDWRQDRESPVIADMAPDISMADIATDHARLVDRLPASAENHRAAFLGVEKSRAASLRLSILTGHDFELRQAPAYQEALRRWRTALTTAARAPAETPELKRLETRLDEDELRAGFLLAPHLSAQVSDPRLLARLSAALRPRQTLFSFLLAEPSSHLWTLSGGTLTHHRLPGRAAVKAMLARFRKAVSSDDDDARLEARELFQVLFGGAPARALANPEWLLSLDDALLSAPLAALLKQERGGERWLAESRSLTVLPSALWLLQKQPKPANSLLAVGDAIHNLADPRLSARMDQNVAPGFPVSFWVWPDQRAAARTVSVELPALPGSRREIELVASVWRAASRPVRMLSGREASQQLVESEFGRAPGVVHFATHVLPVRTQAPMFTLNQPASRRAGARRVAVRRPDDAFLALSVTSESARDGILAGQVPAYHLPGSLVVLSGCGSGLGTIQPGAGLAGFTRAWIGAGARGVVSSLWPVTDDSGAFFLSFYQSLVAGNSSAESLKAAQTAMIRSRSWRAKPRYWAAYFLVGKE
jgi:CHAT domain-containing protein